MKNLFNRNVKMQQKLYGVSNLNVGISLLKPGIF